MSKKPLYGEIDGMLTPPFFGREVLREAMAFKPAPDDVVVATYPKCGTTWTQQIVSLILKKGKPFLNAEDYFNSLPFLEMTTIEKLTSLEKPRCIKTHLPFDRINFSTETKYIHVARHPADCVVSFYHHTRFFPTYFFTDGSFDDFFELFIKGEVDWNDYFDHLLSWYKRRNEPNILFLTFEQIRSDLRGSCLQIAQFLGDSHYKTLVDNNEEVLGKVLEYSSLEFMKQTVNEFWKREFTNIPSENMQRQFPVMKGCAQLLKEAFEQAHVRKGDFTRRGAVGDGKIELSKEQVQRLNERICEKTKDSNVMNLWKTDF